MKLKTWLTAWICSFCISFGAVSALVTAFDLFDVALPGLGVFCLLLCALCAWVFLTRHSAVFLFCFMGAFLVCSLFWHGLWQSIQAVAYQISVVFDSAYDWGVLDISYESETFSQIPAVYFLATIPAISLNWAVCRGDRLFFPLSLGLLPLYPCYVVTDTVPEDWCFLLVLGAALVLVLPQSLRRLSPKYGHRITAIALIPAILLSLFLISSVPEEGCWEHFPVLKSWILPEDQAGGEGSGPSPPTLSYMGMPTRNQVSLSSAGPLQSTNQTVMKVKSGFGGFLYLRYQAFDSYTGTQWRATDLPEEPGSWPSAEALDYLGSVSITSTKAYEGMFLPYYAKDGQYLQLENGKLPNEGQLTEYRISVGSLPEARAFENIPDFSAYLTLPETTREAAEQILREKDLQTPEDILQYVRACASYSLQTGAIPQDETDFAIWFLQNGETGYCVHFATAAAVLLRAAGYPARYVTGYALMTRRGIPATVTENRAHAWVEYADPSQSPYWQIFEATPGDFASDPEPPPSTEPTEPIQTTPPTTQPPPSTQPGTEPSTQETLPTTLPGTSAGPSETVSLPASTPTAGETQPQGQGEASADLGWLWPWLIGLGAGLTVIAGLWSQYRIRFRKRLKKQRAGTPNQQALARWQEILRLSRLLKAQPPEALLELAEKAKFSQHTVSKEELTQLGIYLQQQRKAIAALPVWKRLTLKLIWAI